MKNLITSAQMFDVDAYTIKHQPIAAIDLMENASRAFVKVFKKQFPDKNQKIAVLCGQGNNGGDGLAIARLLHQNSYNNIEVYLICFSARQSDLYHQNLERLTKTAVPIFTVTVAVEFRNIQATLLIDAVLGSGLNKALKGEFLALAKNVNGLGKKIVAVDVPTGMNTEGEIPIDYNGFKVDLVISFQRPKINFFFPESVQACASFKVVKIGLDEKFIEKQQSDWKLTTKRAVKGLLKIRKTFTHKGTYGHALFIAGNATTMGAALLASSASLHTGAGLTTACLPISGLVTLNTLLPEVMALPRTAELTTGDFVKFTIIAVGPGLGIETENELLLEKVIALKKPLVIDADGLTMLSNRSDLLDKLPAGSVLTPHMKEFDRLFGKHENWWQRVQTAKKQAIDRRIIILLKNQYTFICLPNGKVHINATGNPSMASGGMGDVLTGIITALVAQSYTTDEAAILGTYLHGRAGDELAKSTFCINAMQLTLQVPKTIKKILA